MAAIQTDKTELLRLGALHEILRTPGPCITMLTPPYRPGEPGGSHAAFVKADIRDAAQKLTDSGLANSARASLLQPLERYAENPVLTAGAHWGQVIFRSPSVFEHFVLAQPVEHSLTVAGCFEIRKLAKELARPSSFYLLRLSKVGASLLRCAGLQTEVVKLPPGVPETLSEALMLEPPDHDLENRSAAGSSAGAMRGVRFGTGSGREMQHAHLADYYRIIDRGMQTFFKGSGELLILAGVHEDTAIYETVSSYVGLLKETIPGSYDFSRDHAEVLRHAYSILGAEAEKREHAAMEASLTRATPGHFFTDPEMIVRAACEGRIHRLYVNASAQHVGIYERDDYRSWGNEDLLNLAAVQTIVHRGHYSEIPSEAFPNGGAALGILRF